MATTTIPWTTLSQGQTYTLDLYDQTYVPNGQILHFNDTAISAANVLITQLDDTLTRFEVSALGKTVILNTDATRVTTSNITFANGSLLLVGDNSLAGGLDHDDNTLTGGSLRDYLNGLGGDDTLSGGAGADYFEDAYGFNTLLGGNDGDEFDVFLEPGSANVATGGAGRDLYYLDPKSKSLLAPPGSPGNNFHVTDFVVGPTGDMVLVSDLILISINFNDQDPFAAGFLRFRQVG
ncbi:MAG: hypothetical protein ACKVQK_16315, partial [Burkholderiales bacterium]